MSPGNDIVLVTGGTGFIGMRVVRALRRRNLRVRILAKDPPGGQFLPAEPLEYRLGDIRDDIDVRESMVGVGSVCHLAAMVSGWSAVRGLMDSINIGGTRAVVDAALAAGVRRVVYVSSNSAIEYCGSGVQDEKSIAPRTANLTEYGSSKLAAERVVESAGARGLEWVIVYPTRVFGAGTLDDSNAAMRFLALRLRGRLPILPCGDAWANWVYVDDVGEGIVQALQRGKQGERYILGGENATLRDFFALAESIAGRRRATIPIPHALGRLVASAEHARSILTGSPPRLTRKWYDALFEDTRLTTAKAERVLGYRVTPLREALENVVAWLVQSHMLEGGRDGDHHHR